MTWINITYGNLTHAQGANGDIGTAEPLGSEFYE